MQDCQIAILGAGPAGGVAALELARRGFRVVLIGPAPDTRPNVGECLSPGIRPELEKAGVWENFLGAGHSVSAGIRSYWGSDAPADRDFVFSPYGAGWHVDRVRLDTMLRAEAIRNGAVWMECASPRKIERFNAGWRIALGDDAVDASFVIDATGRASVFARQVGARRRSLDRLMGAVAYASGISDIEPVLMVEAVENGWWYSAPLPGGKMVVAFMTDADRIQRAGLMAPDRWTAQLANAPHHRDRVERHAGRLDGPIRIVPAESSFLDRIAGDGWIAAGDAAAAFDPLSSQGIATAISSGMDVAQTVASWSRGDHRALAAYASRIRQNYTRYLANREAYYRMEPRWPDSSFWASRATGVAAI